MNKVWAVLLAAVGACGGPPSLTPRQGPTLLVINSGIGHLVVYDEVGRIATLLPHESRCVFLRQVEKAQVLHLAIEGQTYETPWFNPTAFVGGWRLEVGTVPTYDALTLRPLDPQCSPSARQVDP